MERHLPIFESLYLVFFFFFFLVLVITTQCLGSFLALSPSTITDMSFSTWSLCGLTFVVNMAGYHIIEKYLFEVQSTVDGLLKLFQTLF